MAGAIVPIMAVVFAAFLMIGLALPVLPLHVHQQLGFDAFVIGVVAGSQFAASLISRIWAGRFSDRRGAKKAVVVGLLSAACAGILYGISNLLVATPAISLTVLIVGRAVLGAAESFVITGALGWGLSIVDNRRSGQVIALVGTAMYAAMALGSPVGSVLYASFGFAVIATATVAIPIVALAIVSRLKPAPSQEPAKGDFRKVVGAVWLPGLGLMFSSFGFGVMTAFVTILFVDRGWDAPWIAFSSFALAFIAIRVVCGHLPDRYGGARIAIRFALIEAAGLALIWAAPTPSVAVLGAVLTGIGYSLVYPGLGIEAVVRAPPQSRALAMGSYTAFLDLSLGVASPALGAIGARAGLGTVFLVSAVAVLGAVIVGGALSRQVA